MAWLGDRERARDDRLAGDDRGERGNHQQRDGERGRDHVEERIVDEFGVLDEHRGLPHVVDHERRHADHEPCRGDRDAAEMAHVRIERLGAGDRVDDGAQREEREQRVGLKVADHVERIERSEHGRVLGDMVAAHRRDHREVDQHDGAEQAADVLGTAPLDGKEAGEDGQRDPHDPRLERRADDAETLDRGDDRDGGREHGISEKQRGGEQRAGEQPALGRLFAQLAVDQRIERKAAAFTLVVAAHDDEDILDRDDEDEEPEDQADDSVKIGDRCGQPVARIERGLQRIERAGADIAEHHAERTEGERGAAGASGWIFGVG